MIIGMEKLPICRYHHLELAQLYVLENIRDDPEYNPLPLVGQSFFTFACDLLIDPFLPTEDLDHLNDIHDLHHSLDARIRLRKNKNETSRVVRGEAWLTIFIFFLWTSCILEAIHPNRG